MARLIPTVVRVCRSSVGLCPVWTDRAAAPARTAPGSGPRSSLPGGGADPAVAPTKTADRRPTRVTLDDPHAMAPDPGIHGPLRAGAKSSVAQLQRRVSGCRAGQRSGGGLGGGLGGRLGSGFVAVPAPSPGRGPLGPGPAAAVRLLWPPCAPGRCPGGAAGRCAPSPARPGPAAAVSASSWGRVSSAG